MASQWFVRGGGKVYGPLDDTRLRTLVAEGKIDETTDIATQPCGPWHPAIRVRGLFGTSNSSARDEAQPADGRTIASPSLTAGDDTAFNSHKGAMSELAEREPAQVADSSPLAITPKTKTRTIAAKRFPVVLALIAAGGLLIVVTGAAAILTTNATFLQSREYALSGSVFIVKADGESVRLGLIDVYAIPAGDVTDEIVANLKGALRNLRSAESSIEYNSRPSPFERAFSSPAAAQAHRLEKTLAASTERSHRVARLNEHFAKLVMNAVSHAKTDADGAFEIPLPTSPATSIVAYASRKIDAHSEHYFWIIPSERAKQQKPRLFVSNDNQLR